MNPAINSAFSEFVLIGVCAAIAFALMAFVAGAVLPKSRIRILLPMLLGFAVIGAVAGLVGGNSRQGVVGDIIPAAITFVGSLSLYLFGKNVGQGMFAAFCAATFVFALGLGYSSGAQKRQAHDRFTQASGFCFETFADAALVKDARAFLAHTRSFGPECVTIMSSVLTFNLKDKDKVARKVQMRMHRGMHTSQQEAIAALQRESLIP